LAAAGHAVEVVSSDPLCLARFTRHVARIRRVPSFGREPFAWLEAVRAVLRGVASTFLFPTQEQAALLALEQEAVRDLGVGVAVPPFAALARVQDKLSAFSTLTEVGLRQPAARVASSPDELLATERLPVFAKVPIGTASVGVRHVTTRSSLANAARDLEAAGVFADGGVLAQQPVAGPLAMIQMVFCEGRLVASHTNLRLREGANGGASLKRSIEHATIRGDLERLGVALGWPGALSVDAVIGQDGPFYIDVNPRLVEPGNAWRAGVDLVESMIRLSTHQRVSVQAAGRPGVRTHQLLLALLGAAQQGEGRRGVRDELLNAVRRRGPYRDSREELTPTRRDPWAAVPVAAVTVSTLISPQSSRWFAGGAVASYSLTPTAWREIRAAAGP
jgi:hypothetical protein